MKAWNDAHPSDIMRLPVLKALYYRAEREKRLELEVVTAVLEEYKKAGISWMQIMDGASQYENKTDVGEVEWRKAHRFKPIEEPTEGENERQYDPRKSLLAQ